MLLNKPTTRLGEYVEVSTTGERYRAFVPQSLPPDPPLNTEGLQELLIRAVQALSSLDTRASLLPDVDLFIYMFVRKEALVSSQIEGTQSSLSDLLLYEEEQEPGSEVADVEEVCNYVAALHHGLRLMVEELPLSNRLLKQCHRILLNGSRGRDKNPGEFRESQNWLGGTRPGNARYVPPPHSYVTELMSDLEKFFHDADRSIPTLLKAALAHVQFETIHPFLDGNGRVGRLLVILMLCETKLLQKPVLYLSLFFKEHRELYYDHLQAVRLKGDWEGWCAFFLEGVMSSAHAGEEEIQKIVDLTRDDREKIETLGRARINAQRVYGYLLKHPLTTILKTATTTGLSIPAITRNFGHLQDLGILREITGKGKNRVFEYSAYMRILAQDMEPL
jgi:Fic family protein